MSRDLLALLDSIAATHQGAVTVMRQPCMAIRHEDWRDLMALRAPGKTTFTLALTERERFDLAAALAYAMEADHDLLRLARSGAERQSAEDDLARLQAIRAKLVPEQPA